MERSEASLRLSSREVALRSRLSSPDLNYDTSYKAFSHYTGHRDTIGQGRIYNTALASMQLTSVMAAKEHARIDDLLACPGGAYYLSEFEQKKVEVDRITATVRSMVEEKVLAGMKILDIGCGPFPSFARCARALGAKVYTMDVVVHPEQFWGTEEFLGTVEGISNTHSDGHSFTAPPFLIFTTWVSPRSL